MDINPSLKIAIGFTLAGIVWMSVMSYWTIEASKLAIRTVDGKDICKATIMSTASEFRNAKENGFSSGCSLVILARERFEPFDWGEQAVVVSYLDKRNAIVTASAGYSKMLIQKIGPAQSIGTRFQFLGVIPKPVELPEKRKAANPFLP